MQLSFFGAAHQVTGSCHLVETSSGRILVDCGMFQGSNFNEGRNHDEFGFDPSSIDAVLVTHAHLDHTGRIPKLVRDGFKGKIYMTKATCELARIIWDDALKIMQYNEMKFAMPVLYDEEDIERAANLCIGVDYHEEIRLGEAAAVFKDAGHIFGSAFIEISADGKTVAFSGDLGNKNAPILKDTEQLGVVDLLVCESTYGGREHESRESCDTLLQQLLIEGYKKKGTIMMPAFSIERTQEILYRIDHLRDKGLLPAFPIYVDSPMAINAIPVYKKYPEYYDEEASREYKRGDHFFDFPGLVLTLSRDDSKSINNVPGPKMVIAGAGMMNGGRIVHHALRYLPDPNSTLLIVGYQAQGTLGRRLYEGAESVDIFGEPVDVRCTIKAIGGLSAHADQEKLMEWIGGAQKKPEKLYCVHGEPESATAFAHKVRDAFGIKTFVPEERETVIV